jgi:hypothetical protein
MEDRQVMGESSGTGEVDTKEVRRDLINWMDYTEAGWRGLEPGARRDLLARARSYFEQVARRHRIPEKDFQPPLRDTVESILRAHVPEDRDQIGGRMSGAI